jgi:hypothetical protein
VVLGATHPAPQRQLIHPPAAEHFGQYLARLANDDLRSREGEASQAARDAAALAAFDVPEGRA